MEDFDWNHEMVSYRCTKCFRLQSKEDPDVCEKCVTQAKAALKAAMERVIQDNNTEC